jgi:hypothetical protein
MLATGTDESHATTRLAFVQVGRRQPAAARAAVLFAFGPEGSAPDQAGCHSRIRHTAMGTRRRPHYAPRLPLTENNMSKHDWFWVAVKVAGLICLGSAVFALVMMLVMLGGESFGSVLLRLLINVGVIGAIGIWLIRDGSMLIAWAKASDRDAKPGT